MQHRGTSLLSQQTVCPATCNAEPQCLALPSHARQTKTTEKRTALERRLKDDTVPGQSAPSGREQKVNAGRPHGGETGPTHIKGLIGPPPLQFSAKRRHTRPWAPTAGHTQQKCPEKTQVKQYPDSRSKVKQTIEPGQVKQSHARFNKCT